MKTFLNIIGFTGKSIAMVFGSIIVVFASITLFHAVGIEEPQSSFNEAPTSTLKTEELKANFPTPGIKDKAPENKPDQKVVQETKKEEVDKKTGSENNSIRIKEANESLAKLKKDQEEWENKFEAQKKQREEESQKRIDEINAKERKEREEIAAQRAEQEARQQEEQYQQCTKSRDRCISDAQSALAKIGVLGAGSSSATEMAYRVLGECQSKYKCTRYK